VERNACGSTSGLVILFEGPGPREFGTVKHVLAVFHNYVLLITALLSLLTHIKISL